MDNRFWLSAVVIFVLSLALGFVVHAALLGEDYAKLTGLFRPHAEQQALFAYIVIAVLTTIPVYLIYYAVQPIPGAVVAKQIVLDVIAVVILGTVVAWLNQP